MRSAALAGRPAHGQQGRGPTGERGQVATRRTRLAASRQTGGRARAALALLGLAERPVRGGPAAGIAALGACEGLPRASHGPRQTLVRECGAVRLPARPAAHASGMRQRSKAVAGAGQPRGASAVGAGQEGSARAMGALRRPRTPCPTCACLSGGVWSGGHARSELGAAGPRGRARRCEARQRGEQTLWACETKAWARQCCERGSKQ